MIEYALRFISGKYQGGQFKLKPNQEYIVGRATDVDIVLVEDMVSRKHARISTKNNKVTIVDLGSTNGAFVNGDKVGREPVELNEGDRILIGTSVLKLIATEEPSVTSHSPETSSGSFSASSERSTMSITRHMSGSINEIPLPDLLQLLSTSRKSGVLVIKSEDQEGKIYLRDGNVYYSTINDNIDIIPTKSFYRIVTWKTGTFDLLPPDDVQFLHEIEESTEALLMESMRILDEINRIKNELPDPDGYYTLASPIMEPWKNLTETQLDVLQVVHNLSLIRMVLDHSPYSDLDTYQALLFLINQGFIVQVK